MLSFFSSLKGKRDILALYDNKLDELPIAYELLKVETSFGDTNIIHVGQKNNPPLVLLHGANACAPIAIEALIGLADRFSIYAIDVIGQPNLSEEIRPDMQDNSYGKWMYEIMTRLNLWNAVLVGISFGGFLTWKALAFDEKRISKAFFITPAGLVTGNFLKLQWKVLLPMRLFKWRKKRKYVCKFLDALFTKQDEFSKQFLAQVILHYEIDSSPIPLITKEEAQNIKTPIYVIAAENDVLFPGKKMLKRAKELFPTLQEVLLLKNSKHVPCPSGNEQIIKLIKK